MHIPEIKPCIVVVYTVSLDIAPPHLAWGSSAFAYTRQLHFSFFMSDRLYESISSSSTGRISVIVSAYMKMCL